MFNILFGLTTTKNQKSASLSLCAISGGFPKRTNNACNFAAERLGVKIISWSWNLINKSGTKWKRHFRYNTHIKPWYRYYQTSWTLLSFWCRDEMAAFCIWRFQIHFLLFQLNLFPMVQFKSVGLDNGLALNRRQSIIYISDDIVYWRILEWLGLNEWVQTWKQIHYGNLCWAAAGKMSTAFWL